MGGWGESLGRVGLDWWMGWELGEGGFGLVDGVRVWGGWVWTGGWGESLGRVGLDGWMG